MTGKESQTLSKIIINKFFWVCFSLLIILFTIITCFKISQYNYFFSYDPYYHYFISSNNELINPFSSKITVHNGEALKLDYPTIFRTDTVILNIGSNIPLFKIYQYSGIFLRIIASLLVFSLINRITKEKWISIFSVLIFLFTPYLFYRSLISFPENMVLIFHLLIYLEVVKSIQSKKISLLIFLYLGFASLIHYRSLVVPLMITTAFLTNHFMLYKNIKSFILNLLKGSIIYGIVALPVISNIIIQYYEYSIHSIGVDPTLKKFLASTIQYNPPSIDLYIENLGLFLLLSIFIGFICIKKIKNDKQIFVIFIIFTLTAIFCFLLSRGQEIGLYIPPLRIMSYLSITLIPIMSISLLFFSKLINKLILVLILTFAIISVLFSSFNINGWRAFGADELHAGSKLNELLNNKSVIVWDEINPISIGVNKFNTIEGNYLINRSILASKNKSELINTLKQHYPNKNIYILTKKSLFNYPPKISTENFNIYYLTI